MAKTDKEVVLEQLAIMENTIDDLLKHMWDGEGIDVTWLGVARRKFTDAFASWRRAITKGDA